MGPRRGVAPVHFEGPAGVVKRDFRLRLATAPSWARRPGLHIHQDTLVLTMDLKQTAGAAGRVRVAERNERMAAAVRHLIDRVHQNEADALAGDAGTDARVGELAADAS